MKRIILFLSISFLLAFNIQAGPGDTTVVQTFTYGSPQNDWFQFPADSIEYEKILLYYTLKCNPAQSPACGEWDYLTYTRLYDHTGVLDSVMSSHEWYEIDKLSPDTIRLINSPGYIYDARFEKYIIHPDTVTWGEYLVIHPSSVTLSGFPGDGSPGARGVFLYDAALLASIGLGTQDIKGLGFDWNSYGTTFERPVIRIAQTSQDSLTPELLASMNFTTVYEQGGMIPVDGEVSFPLIQSFAWDSVSNIVLDVSFESKQGPALHWRSQAVSAGKSLVSDGSDYMLEFDGADAINLDPVPFASLDQEVTIAFWRYGDPDKQPQSQSTLHARNSSGDRVLNVHLPWSNGSIYWDAGQSGGYDRIYKAATAAEYEGSWVHWAFTKNTATGSMKIFKNGQLWHSGSSLVKSMSGITSFMIGGINNTALDRFDDAMLDEFAVWDTELTAAQIQSIMYNKPDTTNPAFGNLLAYFDFDEGSGTHVIDHSGLSNGAELFGMPQRLAHGEFTRFKDFSHFGFRPNISFEVGDFLNSYIDSVMLVDSVEAGMVSVVSYLDSALLPMPDDTINAWLPYPVIGFDSLGMPADSNWVQANQILINGLTDYYENPFEIVDRYELMRFITPYGNGLSLGTGWTWIYDITDFKPLLHDSVHLSAGNWQELLDMKVLMIEGTPPRDVVKVENLWNGNYSLNSYDAAVPAKWVHLDPNSSMWRMKSCVTGHQFSNATNCAEFCPKIHSVLVNDTTRYSWQIIQECAENALHPQGGTWIYDRAGWCPGMEGRVYDSELTPFIHSVDSVKLDYNSQTDQYGNYVTEILLVSYGDPNHQLDAAVSGIISPNNWELQSRYNPICGQPEIEIKNAGAQDLTSLDIAYRFAGDTFYHYTWNGSLGFLETEDVVLPAMDFRSAFASSGKFEVEISNPNGGQDEYTHNNGMSSEFALAPVYDKPVIIIFRTNFFPQENTYFVYDDEGNVVHSKTSFASNTLHRDTLILPPGCYEFVMYDSDDDGIAWWANNDGNGLLRFWALYGTVVHNFEPDFGKETRFQFIYSESVGMEEGKSMPQLLLAPNPGNGNLTAMISSENSADLDIEVFDLAGRSVWSGLFNDVRSENININLTFLPQGTYRMVSRHGEKYFQNQIVIVR